MTEGRQRLYSRYVTTHGLGESDGGIWARHRIIPMLPPSRATSILDIGCGPGEVVRLAREAGYQNTRGIDVSDEQVALAHRRGIEGVELADLRPHLASARARYDVIIALDVLEHFDRDEVLPVLDLIARALKPGGTLLARTPNAGSPFFGRYRYGDLTHGLAFTTGSLRQALSSSGFGQVDFAAIAPIPHTVRSSVRFVLWQFIAAAFKFCLAVETGQPRGHIVTQNILVTARR